MPCGAHPGGVELRQCGKLSHCVNAGQERSAGCLAMATEGCSWGGLWGRLVHPWGVAVRRVGPLTCTNCF